MGSFLSSLKHKFLRSRKVSRAREIQCPYHVSSCEQDEMDSVGISGLRVLTPINLPLIQE